MKLIKMIACITLASSTSILAGCAAETNQQSNQQLELHDLIKTSEQTFYGKKDQSVICRNDNDESFNLVFNNIQESTMGAFAYIPIINFAAPLFRKDTKYQYISYGDQAAPYNHLGKITVENQEMDVYRDDWGFTKNRGNLLYLYSSNDKVIHAFRTETGVIPKLSSFYSCR
ncbi:hypothetical protein [Citrobacter portucalensis]|uniref:hypothetical protein n=1 Tax=Citrobacter portucalensis TaxID=1639133 RepID=UPI0021614B51|nr:hypothetical protein [Citrobacter portucalensis]MCS0535342.1 hypothetical protein [Citrobacter portucalensis]